MPQGFNGDALRKTIRERYNVSLGGGLGKLGGTLFRIGHLGNLSVAKGLDLVLKTFEELVKRGRRVVLKLAGPCHTHEAQSLVPGTPQLATKAALPTARQL